jgi:hypothetical protein
VGDVVVDGVANAVVVVAAGDANSSTSLSLDFV